MRIINATALKNRRHRAAEKLAYYLRERAAAEADADKRRLGDEVESAQEEYEAAAQMEREVSFNRIIDPREDTGLTYHEAQAIREKVREISVGGATCRASEFTIDGRSGFIYAGSCYIGKVGWTREGGRWMLNMSEVTYDGRPQFAAPRERTPA